MAAGREPYHDSYGSRVLGEAFQPSLMHYYRTHTPHNLVYQGSWIWCGIADEEGNRYVCMREWKTEYTMNVLICKLEPDIGTCASRLYKRLNMGIIRFEKDEDRQRIIVAPAFEENAFHALLEPQHFLWKDAGGELDLEFRALGPALRYLCPGDREDGFYLSEFCRVTGSLAGRKVSGFGGLDCAFGTPGVGWLQGKIYRILEKRWIVWANRYDDRSVEYGICFDGEADFNLGFVVRDGVAKLSGCSIEMEHFEDGFPSRADVKVGEETYCFQTTGRVSKIKGLMQWANGEMRRGQDGRKVLESFSWLEFFG